MKRVLTLVAIFAAVALIAGSSTAWAAQGPSPSNRVQVWNLNTKNMGGHPGFDYTEFVAYITDPARSAYFPDIVTLQEVARPVEEWPANSCQQFVLQLEARTSVDYRCFETKRKGGAGIAYRTGRLSFKNDLTYSLKAFSGCAVDDAIDPWTGYVLRLQDDINGKFVNVASLHIDDTCTWDNMKLANSKIDSLGSASMRIMAGDWNRTDANPEYGGTFQSWECWYKGTNVDLSVCGSSNLGWKDPMYRDCWEHGTATASAIYNCLRAKHLSTALRRIDFLFAKAYAMDNAVTASWEDADVSAGENPPDGERYSDHRGQGALLTYY